MLTAKAALAATATLISIAFAASTFERFLQRRRRHELAWSISLVMFSVASAALWSGTTVGWDLPTFRVFFVFGAILNVPWLALGTVYLLAGRRVGDCAAVPLSLLSASAIGVMLACPSRGGIPSSGLPKGSEVFGVLPRAMAGVSSGVGALVVIAGALWSAARLVRQRAEPSTAIPTGRPRPGQLVAGNLVIALGTLILGASGILQGRLGQEEGFALTLAVGVGTLFVGFLIATVPGRNRQLRDSS